MVKISFEHSKFEGLKDPVSDIYTIMSRFTGSTSTGGSMISEMANVVAECVKNPTKRSVWVKELGRFVCLESTDGQRALAEVHRTQPSTSSLSQESRRIDPQFKLVFITAAIGTLLFILICVALHIYTDGQPPPAVAKLVEGLLDMAKIGFGAVVGLLGGKALRATQ